MHQEEQEVENRNTLLQRISDGLLPKFITIQLYRPFFKLCDTNINGWSVIHFISGTFVSLLTKDAILALKIHTLWEIFQFIAGDNKFETETMVDISFDTLFFMIGFYCTISFDF